MLSIVNTVPKLPLDMILLQPCMNLKITHFFEIYLNIIIPPSASSWEVSLLKFLKHFFCLAQIELHFLFIVAL
jgi:hypothetical protein